MRQCGFTTLEVLVVTAIAALLCAVAFAFSLGSRPFAMRSAVTQFDATLDYARSLAAASGGATMLISPAGMRVFAGRPTAPGALQPAPIAPGPPSGVAVSEATIGAEPLALFIDSEGRVSIARYTGATPVPLASEPPCPASGVWRITFSDTRSSASRMLACAAPEASP